MNDRPSRRENDAPEAHVSPELALVDTALRTRLLEELPEHDSTVERPRPPAPVQRPEPLPPRPRRRRARRLFGLMTTVALLGATTALLLGVVPRSDSGSAPYFETSPESPTTASGPTESNPQVEEEESASAVWRTLAWAPVRGAVAYDIQIVDNGKIAFRARTQSARIEIPRAKAPAPGEYRWYVWPVVQDGGQLRRTRAVVDARLRVSR